MKDEILKSKDRIYKIKLFKHQKEILPLDVTHRESHVYQGLKSTLIDNKKVLVSF